MNWVSELIGTGFGLGLGVVGLKVFGQGLTIIDIIFSYFSVCKLNEFSFNKEAFKTIYITIGMNFLIILIQIFLLISARNFTRSRKVLSNQNMLCIDLFQF